MERREDGGKGRLERRQREEVRTKGKAEEEVELKRSTMNETKKRKEKGGIKKLREILKLKN